MARFPTPANAITDIADVKVGDVVYGVYGIWPPCTGGAKTVMGAPAPFFMHHEYSDIHEPSKDLIVFDLASADGEYTNMVFASDRNLEPGRSHNDNYIFRSDGDAHAARVWLREQWEAVSEAILRAEFGREVLTSFDDDRQDYQDDDYLEDA